MIGRSTSGAGIRLSTTIEVTNATVTYYFTNHGLSVLANNFDTHWARSRVCHGAEDGHRSDDEGGVHLECGRIDKDRMIELSCSCIDCKCD